MLKNPPAAVAHHSEVQRTELSTPRLFARCGFAGLISSSILQGSPSVIPSVQSVDLEELKTFFRNLLVDDANSVEGDCLTQARIEFE